MQENLIYLDNDTEIQLDFDFYEVSKKVCDYILRQEKCPYPVEISILLTDNENIHIINKDTRNIDRATDVLSFPGLEYESPALFPQDSFIRNTCSDPENGLIILGDMVISLEKVIEQAESYGHSKMREYAFLVAHSILHLCGYDHMEDNERIVMENKQEQYLSDLGITRE